MIFQRFHAASDRQPIPCALGSVTRHVQKETDAKSERAGAWSSVRKYGGCCQGVDSDTKNDLRFPSDLD